MYDIEFYDMMNADIVMWKNSSKIFVKNQQQVRTPE